MGQLHLYLNTGNGHFLVYYEQNNVVQYVASKI